MDILILGLFIFFAIHCTSIINEPWRNRVAAKIGELPWKGLYSIVSIIGFVLILQGYGIARADPVQLYTPAAWLTPVAMLLLVPVFPLLLAAYLPGRVKQTIKHPMLAATKLWALAHLLTNGSLADVVLFGAFLGWAVIDRISMKARVPRTLPGPKRSNSNDWIAIVGGLLLHVAFTLWLHEWLIGVSPV